MATRRNIRKTKRPPKEPMFFDRLGYERGSTTRRNEEKLFGLGYSQEGKEAHLESVADRLVRRDIDGVRYDRTLGFDLYDRKSVGELALSDFIGGWLRGFNRARG